MTDAEIRAQEGARVAAELRTKAATMPRNSQDDLAAVDRVLAVADLHDPAKR